MPDKTGTWGFIKVVRQDGVQSESTCCRYAFALPSKLATVSCCLIHVKVANSLCNKLEFSGENTSRKWGCVKPFIKGDMLYTEHNEFYLKPPFIMQ